MRAPERRRGWRSGAFACAVAAAAACGELGGDRATVQLDDEEVTLDEGVVLHEVRLGSASGGDDPLEPDTIRASAGDVVRFVAADARTYAVAFDVPPLGSAAGAFLKRTGQLRSPPLVEAGTSWVVTFEGAPPGIYPFELASGARGVILLEPAAR